jgi:hypothetical protein
MGALILLSAFMAKEVLRESWKDKVEAVSAAQRTYELNIQFADIYDKLIATGAEVDLTAEYLGVWDKHWTGKTPLKGRNPANC